MDSVSYDDCCELPFDMQGVVQHIHSLPNGSPLLKFWQKYSILNMVTPLIFALIARIL